MGFENPRPAGRTAVPQNPSELNACLAMSFRFGIQRAFTSLNCETATGPNGDKLANDLIHPRMPLSLEDAEPQ